MRISKHSVILALAIFFAALGETGHAENLTVAVRNASSDLSNIPLALFFLAAVVVYLCNRPRVAVRVRARRRRH
jgi:hypothetical protein